jgi:hypothetical protein
MTAPPPPITEPDPSAMTCPDDKVGSCAVCQRKTYRYGLGGSSLCQWCVAPVKEKWGQNVRYISTRS